MKKANKYLRNYVIWPKNYCSTAQNKGLKQILFYKLILINIQTNKVEMILENLIDI
jgi:hypothetical protein